MALAVADKVWMLENSIYAVLSPEGVSPLFFGKMKSCHGSSKLMKNYTSHELLNMEVSIGDSRHGFQVEELLNQVKNYRKELRFASAYSKS